MKSIHVQKLWQVIYMPYNKQYLMISVLRFGVKKYNVCDYKIGNFIKIAFQYISHNAGPLVEPLKPLKKL